MLEQLFDCLDATVKKSTIVEFREFMELHETVTKWCVYSDYCIDDPSKLYNSATFTIIPYIDEFENMRTFMKKLAPKDLKKSKQINQEFCQFIKSGYLFNLSFIFKSGKGHIFHDNPNNAYHSSLAAFNDMLSNWIKNTPSQREYYSKIIKKNNILKQELSRKSFNYKLFNNILLIQFIAAYICYLICDESKVKPEIISWFSDRDNMTTFNNGIIYDLFHVNLHGICDKYVIDDSNIKILFAKNALDSSMVWFDEMLRVPDFLSGALAGRNYTVDGKDKYDILFEEAIAENEFLSVINIYNEDNIKGVNRLSFKKKSNGR